MGRSGMGRGTHGEIEDRSGKLEEVRDGLRDCPWSLGRVGGTSLMSGIGRGTLGEVRDGSGDLWGGSE